MCQEHTVHMFSQKNQSYRNSLGNSYLYEFYYGCDVVQGQLRRVDQLNQPLDVAQFLLPNIHSFNLPIHTCWSYIFMAFIGVHPFGILALSLVSCHANDISCDFEY